MTQTHSLPSDSALQRPRPGPRTARLLVLMVALPLVVAAVVFTLAERYFLSEELEKAQGRLSLYRSTVVSQLERYSYLTYVLARDRMVIATAAGADRDALNDRLGAFAAQSGLDAIYLMDRSGLTISASNAGQPGSFVGQSYSFRPYFQDALRGTQGQFYGIGSTTGLPGYFFADAVTDGQGAVQGVIAIKLGLTQLEQAWRDAGETVFLANSDGVILLSSEPQWRYRTLQSLSADQRARIRETRQFGDQPLEPLNWQPSQSNLASLGGTQLLHLTTDDLPNGWAVHYFSSRAPVTTRSTLVTAAIVIFAAGFIIMTQQRRTARIGAALRRSEAEEAQLREANDRLAIEIEERRAAERRLARTQDELERASRLAALGQLAASVTHELGQPIAAMRNHLTAAEFSGAAQGGFATRISGLVDRMESITRQLKFFARTQGDSIGAVDMRDVARAAVTLVEPNIAAAEVHLDLRLSEAPVDVRGNRFRLEQVLTNLLRNAVDAMADSDRRDLTLSVGADGKTGWCEVSDTGHGLEGAALSDLQEPFFTTRGSGQGMGLGLAISASIVEEHAGKMSARDRPGGGSVFRVEIPLAEGEDDAE